MSGCGKRIVAIAPARFFVRNFSGYDLVYQYSHCVGSPELLSAIDTLPLQADTVIGYDSYTMLIRKNNKYAFLRTMPRKSININATVYTDHQTQARTEMLNQLDFNYDEIVYTRTRENDEVWYAVARTKNQYFLINGMGYQLNQLPYLSVRYLSYSFAFVESMVH